MRFSRPLGFLLAAVLCCACLSPAHAQSYFPEDVPPSQWVPGSVATPEAPVAALSHLGSATVDALRDLSSSRSSDYGAVLSSGQDPTVHGPIGDFVRALLAGSANSPGSSGDRLMRILTVVLFVFLGRFYFPNFLKDIDTSYPPPATEVFQTPRVARVEPDPEDPRIQRWFIESPIMQRTVQLQVVPQKDLTTPAPVLYLLDGVNALEEYNGWFPAGNIIERTSNDNVILVAPLGARGSIYADWNNEDLMLGRMMWETFLIKELIPLLENNQDGINANGKRAVAGVSMGAMGAVRLAAKYPEHWDAVVGLSGCYSTMDPIGRVTMESTIRSRGGTTTNLWGPVGGPQWEANDIVRHFEGLTHLGGYFSAAEGQIDQQILDNSHWVAANFLAYGVVLEQGSYSCTKALENKLLAHGITDKKFAYDEAGLHVWDNFDRHVEPSWQHIRQYLY